LSLLHTRYRRARLVSASILACLLHAIPSTAATWYAGDFIAIGIGPRSIAMGGAVEATVDGNDAAYWNPAGLATSRTTGVSFEHAERFAGIVTHDALSASLPMNAGGLGLVVFRGAVDGIGYADSTVLRDPTAPLSTTNMPDPDRIRTFSNADYVVHVGYGRTVFQTVRVGGAVKLIRRSLDKTSAFGYGLDLGAQWKPTASVAVGVVVRDATTTRVSWDAHGTDVVYPTVHVSTAYTLDAPGGHLTASVGSAFGAASAGYGGLAPWRFLNERNPGTLGAEYSWRDRVMLRVGTRSLRGLIGPGSSHLTAGIGIATEMPWVDSVSRVGLDVSWMRHTLENSFRIGGSVEL